MIRNYVANTPSRGYGIFGVAGQGVAWQGMRRYAPQATPRRGSLRERNIVPLGHAELLVAALAAPDWPAPETVHGRFSAVFLVQCLTAMDARALRLSENADGQ